MGKPQTQQATIRRLQDTLVVLGTGVIAFGVWTLVKSILLYTLGNAHFREQMGQPATAMALEFIYVAVGIGTLCELGFRLYVGLSARAEGFGKRKGWGYIVVVGIMALFSLLSVVVATRALIFLETDAMDFVVTLGIEGTSFVLLVLLIYSSVKLKKIMRATG